MSDTPQETLKKYKEFLNTLEECEPVLDSHGKLLLEKIEEKIESIIVGEETIESLSMALDRFRYNAVTTLYKIFDISDIKAVELTAILVAYLLNIFWGNSTGDAQARIMAMVFHNLTNLVNKDLYPEDEVLVEPTEEETQNEN